MLKWRNESALDLYNLAAAIFLLAAPWMFVRVNPTAAIDLRASGAAIAILSLERFRAKWIPVRVKKTRQIKNLELRF
jgi:hypothetical protein